jgi:hypothetical protein
MGIRLASVLFFHIVGKKNSGSYLEVIDEASCSENHDPYHCSFGILNPRL